MSSRTFWLRVAVGGWLVSTLAGVAWLSLYANRQGEIGRTAERWPADAGFARQPARATLVVALHPGCGCSRATLEQLDRILAARPHALEIVALIARYDNLPAAADVLSDPLSRLRGIARVVDDRAHLARRFGLLTSGHALLYDEAGRLRYSGGLTASRGHAGRSGGLDFMQAWIEGRPAPPLTTFPVFGCLLAHETASASAS